MSGAVLHLVCGLPCSGKTTYAQKLEKELPALWLSPDVWLTQMGSNGYDERLRSAVEELQLKVALRALQLGISVILDWGFWKKAERSELRRRAASVGATTRVHYLNVGRNELLKRLEARNANLPPDTFHVNASDLDTWILSFEAPTSDEE